MNYDEELKRLQEQAGRKKALEAQRSELRAQYSELRNRTQELETRMFREQEDVDQLENLSLASVFFDLVGGKQERLDKERQEAYAARVKYDAARQELARVEEDLRRAEAELQQVADSDGRYEALLREKLAAVKASGSVEGGLILQLEQQMTQITWQRREIGEAMDAGMRALGTAESVLASLSSAQGWGTWDLVGGGMLTDLAKHSRLDEAQARARQLQYELRCFKTELADITIQADMQVNVDGFLRFADYFFDGVFADWMVLDKINRSQAGVENTRRQIEAALDRLRSMDQAAAVRLEELKAQRDAIAAAAKL